jgi:hypothetical protein
MRENRSNSFLVWGHYGFGVTVKWSAEESTLKRLD